MSTPLSNVSTSGTGKFVRDLAERTVWTFIQAFAAVLLASGWFSIDGVTDLSILQKAAVAGIASVLAVIKGTVASQVGQSDSASTAPGV